ncbi:hypothetical protein BDW62DRAFT_198016 [Aspergillus aurantiobrunneus]
MSNQPWLDSLSDDWVSLPGTPTSPAPTRSPINNHSRRSSLQNTPSRIPVPARRSVEPSPSSEAKKNKIPRPCHHIKREPPTPKTPRTPKTPSKLRSPVPKSSPKPNPPSGRKKQPPMDGRSPLRSVSNASSQPGQQSTVQIKPKKENNKQETPEWRKRLVNGNIPAGEQRDLFAPIGLESVFKPPSPGSPLAGSTPIPKMKQPDDGWNFSTNSAAGKNGKSLGRVSRSSRGSGKSVPGQGSRTVERHGKQTTKSRNEELQPPKYSTQLSPHATQSDGDPTNTVQMRSASGMEDLRNEDITPITFSRTNTVDGDGTAEIIKSALKQVTTKLEKLHLAPEDRPVSRASDSVLLGQPSGIAVDSAPEDDLLDVTSHSLPQDLSMGTLDYRGRSAFASLQGDPYSDERSFRKDRVSPMGFPSHRLTPFIRPSSRVRSSPPFYHKNNAQSDPLTVPRPSSAHVGGSMNKIGGMASSGSPLKLFANHDTFTNNKLLRRMSQFEETLGEESDDDEPVSPSEEARRKGENRNLLNTQLDARGERLARRHDHSTSWNSSSPPINRFGEGQLDNFDFSDASPYDTKFLNADSPEPNLALPGNLLSAEGKLPRGHSYRQTSGEYEAFNTLSSAKNASGNHNMDSIAKRDVRPKLNPMPSSPVKDPIPKRRRTIMKSRGSILGDPSIEDSGATDELSLLQRSLVQHGLRYDDNEDALLSGSTTRPRTPTPHQTGSFERKQSSPNRRTQQPEPKDHSPVTQNIPNAVGRPANGEVRKGSITTQDFLNEATKVMNLIRSKGTTKSNLSRVDETDTEEDDGNGSYEEESTLEEFSRPPSREGVDLRRLREPKEPNPRILSHLKKFQEHDELEFGVNGSVMSLHLDDNDTGRGSSDRLQSEHRKRKLPVPPATQEDDLYDFLRLNTGESAKSFSARSIPTGSSQGSHAKGVLSSDIVSHLIPEQVNGLTYDRLKHLWVKEDERKSRTSQQCKDGDEDPFKDIPDLSVDELEEMMRAENSSSPQKTRRSSQDEITGSQSPESVRPDCKGPGLVSEEAPRAPSANLSSVQSGISRSTASHPTSGTRETSWGTDVPKSAASSHDVEHEIKLHEGRMSKPPHHPKEPHHQARAVTISFSSPLVSQIEYSDDDSPSKLRKLAINSQAQAAAAESSALQSADHEQAFQRRSISKIDERSEDTAEDHSLVRRTSEDLETTPGGGNIDESLACLREHGLDTSYSFYLSPLPDFTVDQIDQQLHLEVSYVAQRTHPTSLRQVHGTFALATEDLVKHITEAEPYEPFWEHLRRLTLRCKGLITLHKLSEFCPRLEELDVSENDIGQLSGVPSTLRNLRIQNNRLSNLTAWGHLGNLQYLDISGNELDNLDAVSGLIHLRQLVADNNSLRNIDGVFGLNGLLSLKLRNNRLNSVDFGPAELTRLSELDLSHNELASVRNIDNLPALSQLDLSSNRLEEVQFSSPLNLLRALRLSDNNLRDLDVGLFPALTLLYVDQNCLSTISGLGLTRNLEVLSARDQAISDDYNDGFLEFDLGTVKDIRKVFLSSNKLSPRTLSPSIPLLSLQLLDLATCRLQALPADFAVKFPNVKVLNLNFNSLLGLNELLGMNCLSRLTVAGNSISRLRRLCQVLSRVGRTSKSNTCSLQKVDIRGNPLTVRFYPPPITGSGKHHEQKLLGNKRIRSDLDLPLMSQLERNGQLLVTEGEADDTNPEDPEINDPYTLPPADILLDQKHIAHLDQATRLKRRVFELMLYAGTGGALKFLDGLEFRPVLEPGSDMNQAWTRLEQLGVLKKKEITG